MCRVLEVSNGGYYAWRKRPESRRDRENRRLTVEIKAIHQESRQTYGSPRIHDTLKKKGTECGKNRVARIVRLDGIRAKQKRRFKVTTDSKHDYPVAENLLNRQFNIEGPNRVWAADLSYCVPRIWEPCDYG